MTQTVLLVFFLIAIVTALVSLQVKDLLAASALLSVFSFTAALLYVSLGALDVGFNEAVLGAGVTTVLFLVAVVQTRRRSQD